MIAEAATAIALWATGKPVQVVCETTPGSAYEGMALENRVWLGRLACPDVNRGHGVGLFVYLHELGHTTGISDEGAANCFALDHLRPALRLVYKFRPSRVASEYRAGLDYYRATLNDRYRCVR